MSDAVLNLNPTAAEPALRPVQASATPDLSWTLLGPSPAMSKLWAQIRRVAPHFRTALLIGELGCAQEAVARALHDLSPLNQRHFLCLDATAAEEILAVSGGANSLPAELLIYLADLEKLSAQGQAGLSRLLRTRRPRALGVIGSTRSDLRALVSAGAFSAELASTLGALRITVPALRERTEDLPMLFHTLVQRRCQRLGRPAPLIADAFLREVMSLPWQGNLRQASSALDWLIRHHPDGFWTAEQLHEALASTKRQQPPPPVPVRMVKLDTVMHEHIRAVLLGCKGNKLRAAEILGISRSTLYRMLESLPAAS